MITQDKLINYDQLLADKHSTRLELADAVLPDLLKAAAGSTDPDVLAASAVLEKWDHNANAGSRGAVLFQQFYEDYFAGKLIDPLLRVRWNPAAPLDSAHGLANPTEALQHLASAAQTCRKLYGSLDVPWGDFYRFASGSADLPGNGADGAVGSFRTIQFGRKEGNKHYASAGETFVCAIEFAKTQRANCLLSYGNSSQHGSQHLEDQLPLLVARKLHPVWRDKSEVTAHLELREVF
jgi:acyl-homoserine-lactone acylase